MSLIHSLISLLHAHFNTIQYTNNKLLNTPLFYCLTFLTVYPPPNLIFYSPLVLLFLVFLIKTLKIWIHNSYLVYCHKRKVYITNSQKICFLCFLFFIQHRASNSWLAWATTNCRSDRRWASWLTFSSEPRSFDLGFVVDKSPWETSAKWPDAPDAARAASRARAALWTRTATDLARQRATCTVRYTWPRHSEHSATNETSTETSSEQQQQQLARSGKNGPHSWHVLNRSSRKWAWWSVCSAPWRAASFPQIH